MTMQRYTVEGQPYGAGFYVADNQERCLAYGPCRAEGEAAYACDVLRQPLYGHGAPRVLWAALGRPEQSTWHKDPTPRD